MIVHWLYIFKVRSILLRLVQRAIKLFIIFVSLKDCSQHNHIMAGINQHESNMRQNKP